MSLADLSLRAHAAFSQAWPAFALVAGLLLVGAAAAREGVFARAGALAARAPGGAFALLAALLLVEAAVTAVLNLDTAVVFMTPVLLQAARRRGVPEAPFLYGAVFIANSASLLLPGSNLTNLIVLAQDPVSGSTFRGATLASLDHRGGGDDRVRHLRAPPRARAGPRARRRPAPVPAPNRRARDR